MGNRCVVRIHGNTYTFMMTRCNLISCAGVDSSRKKDFKEPSECGLAQRTVRGEVTKSLKNRKGNPPWLPLRPPVSMKPMTRCTKVKIEYDPMHMSQSSNRIRGSQDGSYERNSFPAG
uniref:Uncharacterized protein n=1 Tax=Tanacetum cinerariifolium TaxID=118510 RepID=A0A6L2LXR8_TANCI|nr:hypothetical protein [Tanacetum cinerariifolium]